MVISNMSYDFADIESKWQKKWEKGKVFEANPDKRKKFFVNFPYPYINLSPHIGHFYTVMRVEAFARYKRLRGYNVLFPQAWHATGSPIVGAANRVKEKEPKQIDALKKEGFSEKEIRKFSKPEHWIKIFGKRWEQGFKSMGLSIDWRRNFITTSLNLYYDKFVQWQFTKLKERNYIGKGKHPVVWCPKDNMPVGDHDRVEGEGEKASIKPTDLTGADLESADVSFEGTTGKPSVGIVFNSDGARKFEEITARNVGKMLPIILDGQPVSSPVVQEKITGGQAQITGDFTLDEAKNLAIQLNAGALPVPVNLIEQRTIGATLGADSVSKSVKAGLVGLFMVLLFMVLSYGKLGLVANVALVIFGSLTLALYKLIPIVLTLPGIAGFLLSVGMAVDSNILIFESNELLNEFIFSTKSFSSFTL